MEPQPQPYTPTPLVWTEPGPPCDDCDRTGLRLLDCRRCIGRKGRIERHCRDCHGTGDRWVACECQRISNNLGGSRLPDADAVRRRLGGAA